MLDINFPILSIMLFLPLIGTLLIFFVTKKQEQARMIALVTSLITMVLAVIDPGADIMRWCSAGHPPPLLVTDGREVRLLDDPDPPCGAFPDTAFRTHTERLAPGDLLFLYTDGLTEARRGELEFGERGLREALLEAVEEPPNALARSVYSAARVWCEGKLNDDVAIAVVRRGGT